MAQSKEGVKHAAAQARLSEEEAVRVGYKHGTPFEAGKVAESEPVDLFSGAQRISNLNQAGSGKGGIKNEEKGEEKEKSPFSISHEEVGYGAGI